MGRIPKTFFEPYPNLMHLEVREKLFKRTHPLGALSVYPKASARFLNFEQRIATSLYLEYIKRFTNLAGITPTEINANSTNLLYRSVHTDITLFEQKFKPRLVELAIDLVKKDFDITDEICFEADIRPIGEIDGVDALSFHQDYTDAIECFTCTEFQQEVERRRLTNSLIQGAAMRGKYLFYLAADELGTLDDKSLNYYAKAGASEDLNHFERSDSLLESYFHHLKSHFLAGINFIDWSRKDGKPLLKVQAINFMYLLHELVKGVMEIIALPSIPKNRDLAEAVIAECDHFYGETWDMRLGPAYWQALHQCIPLEYLEYKKLILSELFAMNTPDFLQFMKLLFTAPAEAEMRLKLIGERIEANILAYDASLF